MSGKKMPKLHTIFFLSSCFFAFFSFFGAYQYKIYSLPWFFAFFVFSLLLYLGLSVGKALGWSDGGGSSFPWRGSGIVVTERGARLLFLLCCLSILSFLYFLYLYTKDVGGTAFGVYGAYTATAFEETGRTSLEKATLLLMQMGGDAAFLILSADTTRSHKALKRLSCLCLFLPGIRYLLMGARFTIAAEFLMLFAVRRQRGVSMMRRWIRRRGGRKKYTFLLIAAAISLGGIFLYLFAARSIYYTALERKLAYPGDMTVRPFWRELYQRTEGRIDFLCTASDYLGEAPYVFSYYCRYHMPDQIFWGQLLMRSVVKIADTLLGLELPSYEGLAGGQYSGFAYALIADFGVVGAFPAAFLFGVLFAWIEARSGDDAVCRTIYPAIQVICFFAPVYYFYVGRIDFTILFCLFLAPVCLRRVRYHIVLEVDPPMDASAGPPERGGIGQEGRASGSQRRPHSGPDLGPCGDV